MSNEYSVIGEQLTVIGERDEGRIRMIREIGKQV